MTDTSRSDQLSQLQRDIISLLAEIGSDFFLTGGVVLAGWILRHRRTDDLDLFTENDAAIASADRLARYISDKTGCAFEAIQSAPDFRRFLLSRGSESVQIDFIRDRAPQLYPKVVRDGVRTDSVEEIVANKICALVGRSEIRDLIDLMYLERAGYRIERFLEPAAKKDAGITSATVAWILSTYRLPEQLPANVSIEEVATFVRDLERRMRNAARPSK
jgi:hypothetical protein